MNITGSVKINSVAVIIRELCRNALTGVLMLRLHDSLKIIGFINGQIVYARSNELQERLGTEIVQSGYISEKELESALMLNKEGIKSGQFLEKKGILNKREVWGCLISLFERIIYATLEWEEGNYEFIPQKKLIVRDMPPIPSTLNLLMKGLRKIKRIPDIHVMHQNPSLLIIRPLLLHPMLRKVELIDSEEMVYRKIREEISMADLFAKLSIERIALREIAYRLHSLGYIEIINSNEMQKGFYSKQGELLPWQKKLEVQNYYEMLDIDKGASRQDIQNAYEILYRKVQEDDSNAQETIDQQICRMLIKNGIDQAYQTLSHALSRNAYDEILNKRELQDKGENVHEKEKIKAEKASLVNKRKAYLLFQEAVQAGDSGSSIEKITLIQQACIKDPMNSYYLYTLGYSLVFELNRVREGEKILLKSLEISPYNAEGWFALYRLYCRLKLPWKARKCLKKACELDSRYNKYFSQDTSMSQNAHKALTKQFILVAIVFLIVLLLYCMLSMNTEIPPPPFIYLH